MRTWWHPLLVQLLRWQLGDRYKLEDEVSVGQKPLQIDILLIQKQGGDLSEEVQETLAGLVEHFNVFTLIEFKSPSDELREGDFRLFLCYALLYCAQQQPKLKPADMTLITIAPLLSKAYREEGELLGATFAPIEPGIWRVSGGLAIHPMIVLETQMLADVKHPLMAVFSPQFLADPLQMHTALTAEGHEIMVAFVAQQIQQFANFGANFAMKHTGTDELHQIRKKWISLIPPEEIAEHFTPEQLLQSVPPEQRMQGLAAEQVLQGLSEQEIQRLEALLKQRSKKGKSSSTPA